MRSIIFKWPLKSFLNFLIDIFLPNYMSMYAHTHICVCMSVYTYKYMGVIHILEEFISVTSREWVEKCMEGVLFQGP